MSGYVQGLHRSQQILLPDTLDDYVTEENPVRFIDAFVNNLDLGAMNFTHSKTKDTGRPPYDPADLLKLYLYGYLNHTRSSRRLERECQHNLEVMWLLKKLSPDFKTIADFRSANATTIRSVFREMVELLKALDLVDRGFVAIDGSQFQAVNSPKRHYSRKDIQERIGQTDAQVDRYLKELDENDKKEAGEVQLPNRIENLKGKIAELKKRQQRNRETLVEMETSGELARSLTDPDCRKMFDYGEMVMAYNTQISVEAKNKLIVDYDVTNSGSDEKQLARMAGRAKEVLDTDHLEVVADKGYYSAEQIVLCNEQGIIPYVANRGEARAQGKRWGMTPEFSIERFVYDPLKDSYTCPRGELLTPTAKYSITKDRGFRGKGWKKYRTLACKSCPEFKTRCSHDRDGRLIWRREHEDLLDETKARITSEEGRRRLDLRSQLVEHPFGTLKRWYGGGHLLLKGLRKVSGETGLMLTAYNMRRVLNIVGVRKLMAHLEIRPKNHFSTS
jgi:transposase